MDGVTQALQLTSSIGVLVGLLAIPFVYMKLRQYFPDKEDVVTKIELEKRIHAWNMERQTAVSEQFAQLRSDIQNTLGAATIVTVKQMDQIVEQLRDIRESSKESFRHASEAKDLAREAKYQAELAQKETTALDRLVMGELDSIKSMLKIALTREGV